MKERRFRGREKINLRDFSLRRRPARSAAERAATKCLFLLHSLKPQHGTPQRFACRLRNSIMADQEPARTVTRLPCLGRRKKSATLSAKLLNERIL